MIDYDESYRCVERRKEPLMAFSIQQLADDSQFSHALRFEESDLTMAQNERDGAGDAFVVDTVLDRG